MTNLQLFVVGAVVAIPTAASMVALVLAAIADGLQNDHKQAQRVKKRNDAD